MINSIKRLKKAIKDLMKYFKNLEKRLSLKDKAYQIIKLGIIRGDLKPGLFLTEEKLSKSMNISRGPIREAFNRLEKEDFIAIIPQRGAMVSNITPQEVKDLFEIRKLLEPVAAKDSLLKISISKMKEIKKEFEKIISIPENKESRDDFFLLDKEFHGLLVEKCGNKKLIKLLENFQDHINWFTSLTFTNYPFKEFAKDHLDIIKAIEKSEKDLVAITIIHHSEHVKNFILSEIVY